MDRESVAWPVEPVGRDGPAGRRLYCGLADHRCAGAHGKDDPGGHDCAHAGAGPAAGRHGHTITGGGPRHDHDRANDGTGAGRGGDVRTVHCNCDAGPNTVTRRAYSPAPGGEMKIRFTIGNEVVTATLNDDAAARISRPCCPSP